MLLSPKSYIMRATSVADCRQLRFIRSSLEFGLDLALSPAVGQAAIDQAQQERAALAHVVPERIERIRHASFECCLKLPRYSAKGSEPVTLGFAIRVPSSRPVTEL